MVMYGEEFQIAQAISTIITGISLIYMVTAVLKDGRWLKITLAVAALFISTLAGVMREFFLFDTFRMVEWVFIVISGFFFLYATISSNRRLEAEA